MQFEDVYRLGDGQVKQSPEVFYAGSLWKVFEHQFVILLYNLEMGDNSTYLQWTDTYSASLL